MSGDTDAVVGVQAGVRVCACVRVHVSLKMICIHHVNTQYNKGRTCVHLDNERRNAYNQQMRMLPEMVPLVSPYSGRLGQVTN